ncbi:MAG: 1,6-anhydro-N-acetylmuramyl-L-alanine amidase AmpD [Marinobacter sp.]|uniref:1,6-anhydro-N-acetylmuramyl-L-alanine amidase AmpD n=1 Tax=Marinobacter sp. TaxID=50741 RepID=UPI00299DDC3B|nr:1,6-anhydro-N-acetylmuramyl-L-alanine amidase AmpD [Marinobacter sp.]MDX1757464.1 1,6-anhydro-N-acetylmuramyl-L-alanine amidase AmpD [Marinobacter sp.]
MAALRETGRLPEARWCPSPNFGPRPDGAGISLLVVHNISLPPGEFGGGEIEQFFCNRLDPTAHPYFRTIAGLKVSAHALIDRDGEVTQFVSLLDRAWHAGRSCFEGEPECNDFSIGIELEGTDEVPYTEAQYVTLVRLTRQIMQAWPAVTPERVTGHCDIAPGRKTDPGPAFDWEYFQSLLAET